MSITNDPFHQAISRQYGSSPAELGSAADPTRTAISTQPKLYGFCEHLADLPDQVRVCRLWMQPGTATSVHLHETKTHFFLVESGQLSLWTETGGEQQHGQHSFCFIPANVPHQLRNDTAQTLRLLEVMNPATFIDKVVLVDPRIERELCSHCVHDLGIPEAELEPFRRALRSSTAILVSQADRALTKPYGHNWLVSAHKLYGISLVNMEPRQSTSLHLHHRRREVFLVRVGELSLSSSGKTRTIPAGTWGTSTPDVAHCLSNQGSGLLEIIELFTPYLLDDKWRLSDRYGRALGEVKHVQ